MPEPNFWGELLRKLRVEQGVTQRRLASKTGVNRNTLGNIERGVRVGDINTMETLLKFLGYELDALVVKNKPPEEKSSCHSAG